MANFKQSGDGAFGVLGTDQGGHGGVIPVSVEWVAASVDKSFFVADRAMRVKGARGRVEAAGTDAGAVTAEIRKVSSGTAITSGVLIHSGSLNLKGTAATNQALTLTTTDADLSLAAGDALAIDFTGVLTAATGCATIFLSPA